MAVLTAGAEAALMAVLRTGAVLTAVVRAGAEAALTAVLRAGAVLGSVRLAVSASESCAGVGGRWRAEPVADQLAAGMRAGRGSH